MIRNALRHLLEREGYLVGDAEGVEELGRETDLRLPDGEGTALLQDCPVAPVRVMTSYASARSAGDAKTRGAVDCIARQFDQETLPRSAQPVLRPRRLEHQGGGLGFDRIVAATHRAREQMVRRGHVCADLYCYRTSVMEIALPPLRERNKDRSAFIEFVLARDCRRFKRPAWILATEALKSVQAYHCWPGNVRELEYALERAAILTDSGSMTPERLGLPKAGPAQDSTPRWEPDGLSHDDCLRRFVPDNRNPMPETQLRRRPGISRQSLSDRRQRRGISRPRSHRSGQGTGESSPMGRLDHHAVPIGNRGCRR